MRKIFLIFFLLASSIYIRAQSLSGTVTDAKTHQPIIGASVYLPQLGLGSVTNQKGDYDIKYLPKGTYYLEVKVPGYRTISNPVTLKGNQILDFKMTVSIIPLKEAVITSLGFATNQQRVTMPVTVVSHRMLLTRNSNTIVGSLASFPGINETTEGPGTAKPQINGLGFNRVLVLMDGEPQEDFQWGDDHGLLIDPYAVHDAEIIRGPASLQYGASAEAGVISFKSAPFAPSGTVQGGVLGEYQVNDGFIGNSAVVGGSHHGFMWDLRVSNEQSHDYSNPKDGYVWGTAWRQDNERIRLGLSRPWGFSHLTFSRLSRRIQVPDGNRDSTGRFLFDTPLNGKLYPTRSNFIAYNPTIAGDKKLEHIEAWWQNSINVGNGRLELDAGYSESIHHDIDTGTVGEGNMIVHDIPYSFKYHIENSKDGLKLVTGINGMYEFENNFPEPPAPYIGDFEIPNYTNFQAGGFAILEKDFKKLTISGGLRYDVIKFKGKEMYLLSAGTPDQTVVPKGTPGAETQFVPFDNTYTGPSGSIGISYNFPHHTYIKLNLSKSFRAPAINELTSNGLNIGSNAIQLGNQHLRAEQGYQTDLIVGNNGEDISFEADGFYNRIHDFIFANRTGSFSEGYPVYEYASNNVAVLTGVSGYFKIHPEVAQWFEIDNGLTYIYSYLPDHSDSTNHIPWTPAPHLTTEIKFNLPDRQHSILRNTYIEIGQAKYWAQHHIYSALYTELPSQPYTLYNLGAGTDFVNPHTGNAICSVFLSCNNLTNIAYVDHLNLAQYFLSYYGNTETVTRRNQGIFNMGRNIGIKVLFLFGDR